MDDNKGILLLVAAALAGVCLVLLFTFVIGWEKVDGSERIVWQGYSGVYDEVAADGMHWYVPLITSPHRYSVATKRFVIDDKVIQPDNDYISDEEKLQNQPDMEPLKVQVQMDRLTKQDLKDGKTTGPTDVLLRCAMQYRLDPTKLVKLHKEKTRLYEQSFVSDIVRDAIISNTTVLDARTIYQGAGRVELQKAISDELKRHKDFSEYGVVVEHFVIREIQLMDTDFLDKITAEARAEQERKTAVKQQDAYEAKAKAEQSKAKAEQFRRLVEAQKQQDILAAEAKAAQVKLAAEADKEKARMEGEGIRLKKVAEAEGVLALGQAEAEAMKLKLMAYQGEGGSRRSRKPRRSGRP